MQSRWRPTCCKPVFSRTPRFHPFPCPLLKNMGFACQKGLFGCQDGALASCSTLLPSNKYEHARAVWAFSRSPHTDQRILPSYTSARPRSTALSLSEVTIPAQQKTHLMEPAFYVLSLKPAAPRPRHQTTPDQHERALRQFGYRAPQRKGSSDI